MTLFGFVWRSVAFYRSTHAAVALGVASAVAVLAGSLLVGSSVRASLASLAASRAGRAAAVIAAETPFTDGLADRLAPAVSAAAPLLSFEGVVQEQRSGRRAANVHIYGVDARFFAFHGVPAQAPVGSEVMLSPDLFEELGVGGDDALIVRVARPTDIPLDSLLGRKEDVGRSIRLRFVAVLEREQMGEFSLVPGQGPVRAAFVPLERLQKDLDLAGRVNTILLAPAPGHRLDAASASAALTPALHAADLGLTLSVPADSQTTIVESSSGLLNEDIARSIADTAGTQRLDATPVLTWLANKMTTAGRTVPYSLVTAIGPPAAGDAALAGMLASAGGSAPPLVLNEWAARDLGATVGDPIELEYYRWADEGKLVSDRASFTIAGVVPMRGLAIDRRLAPDYPGITNSETVGDWDPPFPIDLTLVRPADEEYWKQFRTSPKAFIPLEAGQRLWRTRYGALTSIRLQPADAAAAATIRETAPRRVSPARAGFAVVDLGGQNASAAAGATDFGAYFTYFSFFLMIAALLLAALFFRLSVEQRLPQIGVLRAAGFSLADVRRALTLEGVIVAAAGSALGVLLAIGWAGLMMLGLRTWWIGAVGTTDLRLHVDWWTLAAGVAGGLVAAVISIAITVRGLARFSARELLTGTAAAPAPRARSRAAAAGLVAGAAALTLSGLAIAGLIPPAAGFFGAATLTLVAGLMAVRTVMARRGTQTTPTGLTGIVSLGLANLSWRPGRSLTAAGLVAAAAFLLVSVDAFRKEAGVEAGPASGTGGFALIAESALPIVHDLTTAAGREAAGLDMSDAAMRGVSVFALRLRPGDDASCLNLYRPKQPRVLGIPDRVIESKRFRFARSVASTGETRENPWRLLGPPDAGGVVPAIADATSLQYVLHASVGDEITIDADTARPVRLRIVASLDDTVLQGEILIAEGAFKTIFPEIPGYRVFLVEVAGATADRVDAVAERLEQSFESFGVDAQHTARRLEAYHRVENTYLSTFQALGGLGLVLGTFGLVAVVARNVLERRRELALLGASGYTGRDLQIVIASEHIALVAAGLVIGLVAAAIAITPVALSRSRGLPWHALLWLAAVGIAGMLAAFWATRSVRRLPLVASLRSE